MRFPIFVVICLGLAGCGHQPLGAGGVPVGAGCPALKTYTIERQAKLSAELKACGPACRSLAGALADYYVLRRQVRACHTAGS